MSNPYAAPRATVADPERVVVARPPSVTIGLLILWAVLILWLLGTIPHMREIGAPSDLWAVGYAVYLLGMIFVPGWLLVMMALGRNWARVAAILLQAVDFLWRLYLFVAIEGAQESQLPYLLVPAVVQAVAFLLLYLPRASDWFRARSER